jgi:hypothetical protein
VLNAAKKKKKKLIWISEFDLQYTLLVWILEFRGAFRPPENGNGGPNSRFILLGRSSPPFVLLTEDSVRSSVRVISAS